MKSTYDTICDSLGQTLAQQVRLLATFFCFTSGSPCRAFKGLGFFTVGFVQANYIVSRCLVGTRPCRSVWSENRRARDFNVYLIAGKKKKKPLAHDTIRYSLRVTPAVRAPSNAQIKTGFVRNSIFYFVRAIVNTEFCNAFN